MKKDRGYSWFNLADYEPQRQFGLRDWAVMLSCRKPFTGNAVRFGFDKEPHEVLESFWREYLDKALPCNYQHNKSTERLGSVPVITEITDSLRHGRSDFIHGVALEMLPVRILQLNIDAPDATLIEEFGSWLRKVRKTRPLPIRRRGRPGLNLEITSAHLHSWTNYNILPVLDLDLYDEVKKRGQLSHRKLFEMLNPVVHRNGSPNPDGWGLAARKKAQEALGCLSSLIAQAVPG